MLDEDGEGDAGFTGNERPTIATETFDTGDDVVTLDVLEGNERYELGAVLGKGGMGEVRVCTDRRIGREIAMKVMRKDSRAASPEMRSRFFREARVQGQTEHPSIVPVYDVGSDEAGGLYFTMRRVEGRTLEEVLQALRNKADTAVREFSRHKLLTAFGSACLALHFAHTRAVFHCDLKPANIMLGAFGELYVLDWGLATRAARAMPPAVAIGDSDKRTVSGTPGYMAPELIIGEPADERCDVYALGALLYEILTLEPMHRGRTAQERTEETLRGEIGRPSLRAPDRDIAPELDVICAKATALSKSHRYATARELYDDLERYLEGDRDLSLRRTMSRDHAARASSLADQARDGGPGGASARSDALRLVSRALALDPDNPEALRTLVQLLTQPPTETPAEVIEDMHATERSLDTVRGKGGVIGLLLLATVFPAACLLLGVRNFRSFLVCAVAGFCAVALGILRVQRPRRDGFAPTYLPLAVSGLIGLYGVCIEPTFIIPTIALPFAVGYTLSMDAGRRLLPMIACCASLTVPPVLEWLHLLSPTSTVEGDLSCIVSRMGALPPLSSPMAVFGNLVCVVGACYYALQFRQVLNDTQRRVSVGAWQLRQLLPKEARGTTPPPAR